MFVVQPPDKRTSCECQGRLIGWCKHIWTHVFRCHANFLWWLGRDNPASLPSFQAAWVWFKLINLLEKKSWIYWMTWSVSSSRNFPSFHETDQSMRLAFTLSLEEFCYLSFRLTYNSLALRKGLDWAIFEFTQLYFIHLHFLLSPLLRKHRLCLHHASHPLKESRLTANQ